MFVLQDSDTTIYPADLCSYRSAYNTTSGQYELSNVTFYPPNGTAVQFQGGVRIGYIGKSGRFVGLSGD